jgi:hypothetical protein
MDQRTRVLYQALADFSALTREVRRAKGEIRDLKRAEDELNTSSERNAGRLGQARADATKKQSDAMRTAATMAKRMSDRQSALDGTTRLATDAIQRQNRALGTNATRFLAAAAAARDYTASQRGVAGSAGRAGDATRQASPLGNRRRPSFRPALPDESAADAAARIARNAADAERSTTRWGRAVALLRSQFQQLTPAMVRAHAISNTLHRGFQRFGNWRPNLVPPFVALIPVIAAVVAAINPLISLLGSVGIAAFGLTANIASLSGAFLALPGILSAVVGGIASVIASMGGVGNVFKTYAAMNKAVGKAGSTGGTTGESQADRADRLARAEWNLAKAQRNVQKAQQNLNKARQQALEDLLDLRLEVERASLNEDRAIANLLQARDAYNNVMADPSSQAGDKADAAVAIREAEQDLADVRKRNTEAAAELIEAERRGVEGSERVVDAKEDVQDAIYAEQDAQKALRQDVQGTTAAVTAAETATNEYEAALAKLSPSARAVVLALIGLQDEWNAMRSDLQENFFSRFVGDMDKLPQIIQNIGNFLRPAARAMGDFVSALIGLLSSPEWSRDLAKIGDENGKVIDNLGRGFLSLATFFKDLTLAAAPFTDWLTGAFADGLGNLSALLDTDPEKQGLAAWLDIVRGRLIKWWAIIKNVGTTLFNYGKAASGFGDWLSDGFLRTTENWRQASERAMEAGSPFKKFLDEISKPGGVLENVNGLLGQFFGWMGREIMDPENIQDANDLVSVLRNDLGPALAGLLDALAKTDIDEKIIQAISSIITSITEIIDAGGGAAFETFADIITGFFKGVADFLGNLKPGEAEFLLSLIGGLAALSFIGKFTGITNLVGSLLTLAGKSGALTAMFSAMKGASALPAIVPAGAAGAAGAGTAGTAAVTTSGGFFGMLGLLGASLFGTSPNTFGDKDILEDREANKGKGFWDTFWGMFWGGDRSGFATTDEIKNGTGPAGTNPFGPAPLSDPFAAGQGAPGFNNVAAPKFTLFDGIQTAWSTAWAGAKLWWGEELPRFFQETGTNFSNGWASVTSFFDTTFIQPVKTGWSNIQTAFQIGWSWLNSNVLLPLQTAFQIAGMWVNNTFIRPIQAGWTNLQTALQIAWYWINNNVIIPFQNGMTTLGTWVSNAVTGIGNTFNKMKELFAAPIRFVVNTVYNSDTGIRGLWNKVNDALKLNMRLDPISTNFAEGGVYGKNRSVLPGYNPGIDNHHFVDQNGNRLNLGGGEGILVPQATRMLGGARGIEDINRKAKSGASFATGGVFGGAPKRKPRTGGPWEEVTKFAGDVFNNVSSFVRDTAGNVTNFFSNPVKFVTDAVKTPVNNILRGMPDSGRFSEMIKSWPSNVINGLTNFSKLKADQGNKQRQQEQDMAGGGPAPANVMGWRAQWDAVKKAFPSAWKSSDYRPGDPLYHGKGRAIDVSPSMAIFNWIKSNYPNSRELIYTPAGGRQLQNGQETTWRPEIAKAHWDHVHWAMREGGVFPGRRGLGAGTHDKGGKLRHGQAALNLSGKTEAFLTNEESKGLKALMMGTGLSRGMSSLGLPASVGSLQGAAAQIVDNSINIDKVEINNPTDEPVSESLPKSIRRIGYMQNARENA